MPLPIKSPSLEITSTNVPGFRRFWGWRIIRLNIQGWRELRLAFSDITGSSIVQCTGISIFYDSPLERGDKGVCKFAVTHPQPLFLEGSFKSRCRRQPNLNGDL